MSTHALTRDAHALADLRRSAYLDARRARRIRVALLMLVAIVVGMIAIPFVSAAQELGGYVPDPTNPFSGLVALAIPIVTALVVQFMKSKFFPWLTTDGQKYIPIITVVLGVAQGYLIQWMGFVHFGDLWYQQLLTAVVGGLLGVASTGIHQIGKQLSSGSTPTPPTPGA